VVRAVQALLLHHKSSQDNQACHSTCKVKDQDSLNRLHHRITRSATAARDRLQVSMVCHAHRDAEGASTLSKIYTND
jgi:hypothetical protein